MHRLTVTVDSETMQVAHVWNCLSYCACISMCIAHIMHIENITMHATNSYKLQQLYSCRYLGVTPFSALTLLLVIVNRKGIRPVKSLVLVCWWWQFIAPVVITTSIILSSSIIQNEDILVLANPGPPGKWLLNTHIDEQLNWHEHINYVLQTI